MQYVLGNISSCYSETTEVFDEFDTKGVNPSILR